MVGYMEVQFFQLGQAFVSAMVRKHNKLIEDLASLNTITAIKIAELGPRFTDESIPVDAARLIDTLDKDPTNLEEGKGGHHQ